jgi:hypothetical protein
MRRPLPVWLGIGAGIAALDLWCDRNATVGDTASECARVLFHTHTPLGRAAFVVSWAALSAWLVPHIVKETR